MWFEALKSCHNDSRIPCWPCHCDLKKRSFLTPPCIRGGMAEVKTALNHVLLVLMWFEVSTMNPCPRPTLPLWPVFDLTITHFWGVHSWCMAMAKNTSNQLGICPWKMHVRPMPKLSIFIAVTTKKRRKRLKKQAKMARSWPKRAIMAGPWHGRHFLSMSMGD